MDLPPKVKQAIFALGTHLNMFSMGMAIGYPTVFNPVILDPNSDVIASKSQAAWLASLPGISGLIPVFLLSPIMHIYGRRTANFCVTIVVMIGWILSAFAYSLPMLFLARFLQGFCMGCAYFFSICISELSCPSLRGLLLNFKVTSVALGITTVHSTGHFFNWRIAGLVGAIPTGIALVITYFWPESPEWLMYKGRMEEAKSVFCYLHGNKTDTVEEIEKMIERVEIKRDFANDNWIKQFKNNFRSKVLWRPLILLVLVISIPELGGRHYIPAYSIEIATQINGKENAFAYTIAVDTINIFASLLSVIIVKTFPRRTIVFYSGYCAVTVMSIATLLMYINDHLNNNILQWVVLVLLAVYFFLVFSGTFVMTYIIMGEIVPMEYRALAFVVDGLCDSIYLTVILRTVPIMKESAGVHGMFFTYTVLMLIPLTYMYYHLPETKGRTLRDISDYYIGKSPKVRVPCKRKLIDEENTDQTRLDLIRK